MVFGHLPIFFHLFQFSGKKEMTGLQTAG